MTSVIIPALLGSRLKLVRWYKEDGSIVELGEQIAELQIEGSPGLTDCNTEFPSPGSGRLTLLVASGSVVSPGQQIGIIE